MAEPNRLLAAQMPNGGLSPQLAYNRLLGPISSEEEYLQSLSPIDALKFNREYQNNRLLSPQEAASNRQQNLMDLGYITPIVGNVMSAMDVPRYLNEASENVGKDGKAVRSNTLLAALSGLGTITGLPFGKYAKDIAQTAKDSTRIFAGPMAKTADKEALKKADDEFRYVRRTRGGNPDTGVGYMMFLDSKGNVDDTVGALQGYGPNAWLGKPVSPANAEDLAPDLLRAMERRGLLDEYPYDLDSLTEAVSPRSIRNSADFWDNPDLVQVAWEDVLDPKGYKSVLTPDGLILFDPSGVKPYR